MFHNFMIGVNPVLSVVASPLPDKKSPGITKEGSVLRKRRSSSIQSLSKGVQVSLSSYRKVGPLEGEDVCILPVKHEEDSRPSSIGDGATIETDDDFHSEIADEAPSKPHITLL